MPTGCGAPSVDFLKPITFGGTVAGTEGYETPRPADSIGGSDYWVAYSTVLELRPPALCEDVPSFAALPPGSHPDCVLVWRHLPMPRLPAILTAIPPLIATDPDIPWTWRGRRMLGNDVRRLSVDHHIGGPCGSDTERSTQQTAQKKLSHRSLLGTTWCTRGAVQRNGPIRKHLEGATPTSSFKQRRSNKAWMPPRWRPALYIEQRCHPRLRGS
jgi:hypothetical protein